ncbi:MAG TPA: hypothetical protein VFV38_38225 [Ktedonobacteraceae bacterium]|nr:hypothetical protein [Ktedonobacteraceae bacterium]
MLSSDDTGASIIRASRAASRRELIQSKRTRHTDMLPEVSEQSTTGRMTRLQATSHLREENTHLHKELETLQAQLELYKSSMDLLDGEIETIHHSHQQEIEQYQEHLRSMMEERNHMQETNEQWERRYQELYHSFQDAVEEEANKLVKEAAQTLVLSPEHTPALLNDVVRTLEGQLRQTEDQRTAELLAVMRQAQYKAELLEQEVARERVELAAGREELRLMQASISAQAQQRYTTERARLKARWTAGLTLVSMFLFSLMVILELILYSLHFALYIVLFVPLGICLALSYVFAHLHTAGRIKVQGKVQPQKQAAKKAKPAPKLVQQAKSPAR